MTRSLKWVTSSPIIPFHIGKSMGIIRVPQSEKKASRETNMCLFEGLEGKVDERNITCPSGESCKKYLRLSWGIELCASIHMCILL